MKLGVQQVISVNEIMLGAVMVSVMLSVLCPYCKKAACCVCPVKYSAFSHVACQAGCTFFSWNIQLEYTSERYLMKSSVSLHGGGELSAFIATKGISHQRVLSWTSVCLSWKRRGAVVLLVLSLRSPSSSRSNSCRNKFSFLSSE